MAKKSNKRIWLAVMVIFLAVVGYFYGTDRPANQPSNSAHYQLEKTGATATVDFTQSAKNIHAAVDAVLARKDIRLTDHKEADKEVPRQGIEGKIRWHVREMGVKVPADSVESLQRELTTAVKKSGGELFVIQPDQFQGTPALRLDIGVKDQLAGDAVTVITDKLYIMEKKLAATQTPVKTRGELALVIDDFGYTKEPISAFAAIPKPLTFAVLPYRTYSNEAAARAISSGHQVMLHLPIEPLAAAEQSEQITVTVAMSDQDIQATVANAIQAVPGIIGVNNHQGSRGTADKRVMVNVLSVIKSHSLFFIDSRTNSQSIAYDTAHQLGIRSGENNLFLDNEDEVAAIKRQLRKAAEIAVQRGTAIAIGHARLTTATAVKEMLPEFEAAGIKLVFASEVVK